MTEPRQTDLTGRESPVSCEQAARKGAHVEGEKRKPRRSVMKLVRCRKCGRAHKCPKTMTAQEQAKKAAQARWRKDAVNT